MMQVERLIQLVGDALEVDPATITLASRSREQVLARAVVARLLIRAHQMTPAQAGEALGGLHRATITHSQDKLDALLKEDEELAVLIDVLVAQAELMKRFADFTADDILWMAKRAAYSRRAAMALNTNQVMAISYLASGVFEIARTAEVLAWHLTQDHDPVAIEAIAQSIREEMAALRGDDPTEKESAHA